MTTCRSFLLAMLGLAVLLPDDASAQRNRNYRGAPTDLGFRSPSRDWGIGPTNTTNSGRIGQGNRFGTYRSFGYGYGSFYGPVYGGVYGWPGYVNSCCPFCGSYWCDGWCGGGTFWIPPAVVVDSGQLFGPQGVRNFLGGNRAAAPAAQAVEIPQPPAVAPAPPLPPRANATARKRAIKFLQYGDRHFEAGRYRQALSRYKTAGSSASDMAEVEFRQAFAELMLGNFSDAALAVRRGMAKTANWPDADFAIDDLFSAAAKAEAYHLLHERLLATDFDADAHFMLGVMLHFEGRLQAAQGHFLRTVELLGQAEHARAFLPEQPEAKAAAEVGKGQ